MVQLKCKSGIMRHYSISEDGTVCCTVLPEMVLRTRLQGKKKQYSQTQIMYKGKIKWYFTHRLVAYSFLGGPSHRRKTIVDHIDGNSLNNHFRNLRWVTPTVNNLNKKCYGLVKEGSYFYPRIMGFTHLKYGSRDEEIASKLRTTLLESYIKYGNRFPEKKYTHMIKYTRFR